MIYMKIPAVAGSRIFIFLNVNQSNQVAEEISQNITEVSKASEQMVG